MTGVLIGAAAVLGAAVLFSCSFQDVSLTTIELVAPSAAECGACHVAIYDEWKVSRHAAAFVNDDFRDETWDYQVEACLPCHIPETVANAGARVRARSFFRSEGVTCVACHLIEGEHHGPFFSESMTTPHATAYDPELYLKADICGTCHEGTFETWSQSRERDPEVKTCQQCHMETVRRKLTQATDLISSAIVSLHDEYDVRRHTFNAAVLPSDEPVEISMSGAGEDRRIEIVNLLPHAIPTGDFGFRKVEVAVFAGPGEGAERIVARRELYKDLDTELKPGEALAIPIPENGGGPPGGEQKVRVILQRVDRAGGVVFSIAEETFPAQAGHGS